MCNSYCNNNIISLLKVINCQISLKIKVLRVLTIILGVLSIKSIIVSILLQLYGYYSLLYNIL